MLNKRILAVIKRELREKLFSRSFIVMTLFVPAILFVAIGVQALLMSNQQKNLKVDIVSDSLALTNTLQSDFLSSNLAKDGKYLFTFKTMNQDELTQYLNSQRQNINDEKLGGIVYIPATALKDKKIDYYSKSSQNFALFKDFDSPINKALIDSYFANRTLSKNDMSFLRSSVNFTGYKVSKEGSVKEEGYGNMIIAYLLTFLLYLSMIMIGQMTMQSVIEEKGSKIVEVILSSVSPTELMTGKILGASITGVVQMAVWLSPVILLMSTSIFVLPKEFLFSISSTVIIYTLINFFIGLLTFIGLYSMMGAIFDNAQEAASGAMPVMMLILIPFIIAMSMIDNPNRPVAVIASYFPFASIMVMPMRLTLVGVQVWQLVVASIINILTFVAIFPVAGKIYRVGILRTGKKPKWSEVIKWLKYKY